MEDKMQWRSKSHWLVLGVVLHALAHMTYGIGVLAFFAPIPFLRYLRETSGVKSRVVFGLALFAGYSLATAKLITEPLHPVFALLFSAPVAAFFLVAYLAWDVIRPRVPEWISVLTFPSAMIIAEFAQHRVTEFGSWGAAAYTQVDNLPLLQLASLGGIALVSFVVYWIAASLESLLSRGREALRPFVVAASFGALAFAFGTLRLASARTGETMTVAAIGTDATFGGWPLPSNEELQRINDGLFERTAHAARAGATLVAWNEAATAVQPGDESAFQERLRAAAREHQVDIVASYIVPYDTERRFDNKYVWVRPDGNIDHEYFKHHPVPGEPSNPGTSAPRVVEVDGVLATGAICYDYDFPSIGLEHARTEIDLAVVPSSDWRGIDPIHTQMASVRAIEGGFSLLRSTRFGLSGGFDAYGRARAWESSFDTERRVLMVALPRQGVSTLYTMFGDSFVGFAGLFVMLAFIAPRLAPRWRRIPLGARLSRA
jgi:apolipoprotein N-acyltransferase